MKKTALYLFLFLSPAMGFTQGETSNWYFGQRAGIRFNQDGSVTSLDDGLLRTFEGCASISDSFGDLLFYTDGITVYDRSHRIMENGRSLYGDASSTQSAIIVPNPADPALHYIFTVDTKIFDNDPDFGLNYSVVDMRLNGGNGAVTVKNIQLLADCSEKIAAIIRDCADQSFWVITLATDDGSSGLMNTYHAFEISAAGVNPVSVKSTFADIAIQDPRGYLKLSPDGNRLASANATSGLYLYDFDSATGIVSNQYKIDINGVNKASYGLEFSPNGELLYVHASNDIQGETGHSSSLYQYDMTAADIAGSEFLIDKRNTYRAGLQLGPNGKIYRTIAASYTQGTSFLGAINNPNARGDAADYEHRAVDLGGNVGTQGLPPFVQSFFDKTAIIRNADGSTSSTLEICEGESFLLQTDTISGALYEWEKDGMAINATGNEFSITDVNISDSGRYTVKVSTPDPQECPIIGEAYIRVNPVPTASGLALIECDVDPGASEDGLALFNLEKSINDEELEYLFYESLTDLNNGNPITDITRYRNTIPFNQTIYIRTINSFGCSSEGEITLEVLSNPFDSSIDYTLYTCDEDPDDGVLSGSFNLGEFAMDQFPGIDASFFANPEDVSIEANPLPTDHNTVSSLIYAKLESDNLCLGVERIDLEVLPSPTFELEERYLLCTNKPELLLKAPSGFDIYEWRKKEGGNLIVISDQAVVTITELGVYELVTGFVYDLDGISVRCDESFEFVVEPSNTAIIEEVLVEDFSSSNSVQVLASGSGIYEYSLDGEDFQNSELFNDVPPGFYTVYIRDKNGCGVSTRDISVLGYPKFFTPNGDGVNDLWRITGTSDQFESDAFITIYDRFGKLLTQINPMDGGWNGTIRSNPLPASDYWFRVKLSDGREIRGHFALKR